MAHFRSFGLIFFITSAFFTTYPSLAAAIELRLELGQTYPLLKLSPSSFQKIWVENKNVLSVEKIKNRLHFKAGGLGYSHVRLDEKIVLIYVQPMGTENSYKNWTETLKKYSHLKAHYCGVFVCIRGALKNFSEYLEMLKLIRLNGQSVYFTDEASENWQSDLRRYISNVLRREGYTPQQLIFADTWRMYYSAEDPILKNTLSQLGIELYVKKQITQLSDNVEVNVRIAEVSKNFSRKFGLQWPAQFEAQLLSSGSLKGADSFELSLNAAESSGEAKILASPRLITRHQKEAQFFAGGEFPLRVSSHRHSRIEWRKFGISLKLKPQIDSLGQLSLELETEISSVNTALRVDDVPAVQMNKVSSHFDMVSGKTIVLSGLLRQETGHNREGISFLSQIPILGSLFSSRNFLENKSELLIFVTPRLVSTELAEVDDAI